MGDIIKVGVILMLITAVSGASLAGIYNLTKDRIAEQERLVKEEARKIALPEAAKFEEATAEDMKYWKGFDENGNLIGYVIECVKSGYSSEIQTTVGVEEDFDEIEGVKITFQQETPGLGAKIEEVKSGDDRAWFQKQFIGKNPEKEADLDVDKDKGNIESVTGATISSRTVTESIDETLDELKKALNK